MQLAAKHYCGAYQCMCGAVVKWQSSVAKHKRRCAVYKGYLATHGKDVEETFNVIEIPLNDSAFINNEDTTNDEISNVDMTQVEGAKQTYKEVTDQIVGNGDNQNT